MQYIYPNFDMHTQSTMDMVVPALALVIGLLIVSFQLFKGLSDSKLITSSIISAIVLFRIDLAILYGISQTLCRLLIGGGLYYAATYYYNNTCNPRILKKVFILAIGLALFSNDWWST